MTQFRRQSDERIRRSLIESGSIQDTVWRWHHHIVGSVLGQETRLSHIGHVENQEPT
ncbi:hypothetical protein K474DRAFT_477717 [Panus rudis PR-1116 ss-1]|nr:hypothetical protein K474DRAFT_477717 [Panus rudis PR-1116 ss-1]